MPLCCSQCSEVLGHCGCDAVGDAFAQGWGAELRAGAIWQAQLLLVLGSKVTVFPSYFCETPFPARAESRKRVLSSPPRAGITETYFYSMSPPPVHGGTEAMPGMPALDKMALVALIFWLHWFFGV